MLPEAVSLVQRRWAVELMIWMAVWFAATLALVPTLVVGSWFVIIYVVVGMIDGILWLLDQGWRTRGGRKAAAGPVPALIAPRAVIPDAS